MERIRQIWMSSSATVEPLRTTSTFDDDEAFLSTARQLLSTGNILASLQRDQRLSFLEGLRARRRNVHLLSPQMAQILQALQPIEQVLAAAVEGEHGSSSATYCNQHQHKPGAPKTKRSRRFFAGGGDGDSTGSSSGSTRTRRPTGFRKNTRRVGAQNIDLCEAVDNLCLAENPASDSNVGSYYHQPYCTVTGQQNHFQHQHYYAATSSPSTHPSQNVF